MQNSHILVPVVVLFLFQFSVDRADRTVLAALHAPGLQAVFPHEEWSWQVRLSEKLGSWLLPLEQSPCHSCSKELAVRGSSREDGGSDRSRQAGHRNEGRKAIEQKGCWEDWCTPERDCISFKGIHHQVKSCQSAKKCPVVFKAF